MLRIRIRIRVDKHWFGSPGSWSQEIGKKKKKIILISKFSKMFLYQDKYIPELII